MKITNILADEAILAEIGQRIANRRVELNLTQADVAKQAGVSKRTVENIESGASGQMSTMIRIFRVLDLMENMDRLIPEAVPKPIDLLKQKNKIRVRASSKKSAKKKTTKAWQWQEDK